MSRLSVVVALGLGVVALASSPARAFTDETVVAHVPFAFQLGQRTFPAGDYWISPLSPLQQQVLFIRTADGHNPILVMTQPAEPERADAQPRLVFDKVGSQMFLHAVELPGDTGAALPVSPSEVGAERRLVSHPPAAGTTAPAKLGS